MCGIIGYIGIKKIITILLNCLKKLEYRGYDSTGIAINTKKKIEIIKTTGNVNKLINMIKKNRFIINGYSGIGHTRWATHGVPSIINAHPQYNKNHTIAIVHNGIIENYINIKYKLMNYGYKFISDTDTEVIVHLLDYYYYYLNNNVLTTIIKVINKLNGSYAIGIIFKDKPNCLYAIKNNSPLIVGKSDIGCFISSDILTVLNYTKKIYSIDNNEIICITNKNITFYDINKNKLNKKIINFNLNFNKINKNGYKFFMLKEIHEQPYVIDNILNIYIKNNKNVIIDKLNISSNKIKYINKIYMIACGSSYYTCAVAKYLFEKFAKITVIIDIASEFQYKLPLYNSNDLLIIVSQSGETADALMVLRKSKKYKINIICIINSINSSMEIESNNIIYIYAGPEISVVTTKAYSAQLIIHYLLALKFAEIKSTIDNIEIFKIINELRKISKKISIILKNEYIIKKIANKYIYMNNIFFIGRGLDYINSLEGSLKFKEVSYIYSLAYPAGELKHGSIALIEKGTFVFVIITQISLYKKILNNIQEIKSRGAFIFVITSILNNEIKKNANYIIYIPKINNYFSNSLSIIPIQLFSYYLSLAKGINIDQPRNLAKSVTVE